MTNKERAFELVNEWVDYPEDYPILQDMIIKALDEAEERGAKKVKINKDGWENYQ